MIAGNAPAPKRTPPATNLIAWYQERYCRPCGAGCAAGSVEMALCVQARLAQATRETPGKTDGKDA